MRFDYTTIGHVTADLMADGSRRPGGSAFYSALQASRLGCRALIITRGEETEIERLLEPYRGELELEILPAPQTTTLQSIGEGADRQQRVLAWAGPIAEDLPIDTAIVHLAPIARETPRRWRGGADLVGLTPQGLVRSWEREGAQMFHVPLAPGQLPERWHAAVISEAERESCALLFDEQQGVVAVTHAAAPTSIHRPGEPAGWVQVPPIEDFRDDVGAGDVFAAAFFLALHERRSPPDAARFANAAAALRISGAGADAIAARPAIEARLRTNA